MRIRNIHDIPPTDPSPLSPTGRHFDDHAFALTSSESSPHVMISRINGRINKVDSTSRSTFNQEQDREVGREDEEEEMYVTPANQSLIGGWREEEKAMPLKKRRFLSFEVEQEGSDDIDGRGKMVKVEGGEDMSMRCGRTDGKKWRCSERRAEGYSLCEHHLLIRRVRRRSQNLTKREIGDDLDDEKNKKGTKAGEGCFGNNNNNNKKKKKVKARSINSLLRDSVPSMPLNL